jgi:pyruvate dehydrogenase E2 component (dihydrolipoamide acetyltransferase)
MNTFQVVKSAALALRDTPEVNGRWDSKLKEQVRCMSHHIHNKSIRNNVNGKVLGNGNVDISVAVATPNGLITPIVTTADKRGVQDINSTVHICMTSGIYIGEFMHFGQVKDLATRARDGKLKPEEYQGGSFTISNLGNDSRK